ncbi:hypothetical protein [Streptomyces phaeofaciens]|uniref:hypothetical protein n=1 Tax=Streptomyces phaeofaciens TaxID=68254 RepID=UPI0036BEEF83
MPAAAGVTPDTPHDGHCLLDPRNDREHLLAEWWWNRQDTVPIHTWASYAGKGEQYTEYHRGRLGADGRARGTPEVLLREYDDLRADPYQLTNLLHGADAEREARLRIPEPSRRLRAAAGSG